MSIKQTKEQTTEKLLPDLPSGYEPGQIEIHDKRGLLVKIKHNKIVETKSRPAGYVSKFICWYVDGIKQKDIAYIHTNKSVLVNRISKIDTSRITN